MMWIDGMEEPQSRRDERALERAIYSVQPLTFATTGTNSVPYGVDGVAARLLQADRESIEVKRERTTTIIAAAARPFLEALQTAEGRDELRRSQAITPCRFNNTQLQHPSKLAKQLGALEYMDAHMYTTRAVKLIFAAELARVALGSNCDIHPAFEAIADKQLASSWDALFQQAMTDFAGIYGATTLGVNASGDQFVIGWWSERSGERRRWELITPAKIVAEAKTRDARDREFWRTTIKSSNESPDIWAQYTETPGSMQQFIDCVLPIDHQALLAYEGLYFAAYGRQRVQNPLVTYASSREDVRPEQWGKLFNNLIHRVSDNAKLLAGGRLLPA